LYSFHRWAKVLDLRTGGSRSADEIEKCYDVILWPIPGPYVLLPEPDWQSGSGDSRGAPCAISLEYLPSTWMQIRKREKKTVSRTLNDRSPSRTGSSCRTVHEKHGKQCRCALYAIGFERVSILRVFCETKNERNWRSKRWLDPGKELCCASYRDQLLDIGYM
jgi:hypothetical protein